MTSVARQSSGTQEGMVDSPSDYQEADRTKFRERAPQAVPAKMVLKQLSALVFVPVTVLRFQDKW